MLGVLEEAEAGEVEHHDTLEDLACPPGGRDDQVSSVSRAASEQHGVDCQGRGSKVLSEELSREYCALTLPELTPAFQCHS